MQFYLLQRRPISPAPYVPPRTDSHRRRNKIRRPYLSNPNLSSNPPTASMKIRSHSPFRNKGQAPQPGDFTGVPPKALRSSRSREVRAQERTRAATSDASIASNQLTNGSCDSNNTNESILVDEEALNFRLLPFQNQMEHLDKFDRLNHLPTRGSVTRTFSPDLAEVVDLPPTKHVMFSTSGDVIINDVTEEIYYNDSCSCGYQDLYRSDENYADSISEPIYDTIADSSCTGSLRSADSLRDYEFIISREPNFDHILPAELPQLQAPLVKDCLKYSNNISSLADTGNEDEDGDLLPAEDFGAGPDVPSSKFMA